ncbi:hypothetical protein PSAB6_460060 [Paraburkholderia sabiae]|nr:hypothetical protein PSAB6_460060 [Paraburkholderia sabiae]
MRRKILARVPMRLLTNGRAGAQRVIVANLTGVFGIHAAGARINCNENSDLAMFSCRGCINPNVTADGRRQPSREPASRQPARSQNARIVVCSRPRCRFHVRTSSE